MNTLSRPGPDFTAVPSVLLTPNAFFDASSRHFRDIRPNDEGMAAIAELTKAPFMPDVTIMRLHDRLLPSGRDQVYAKADAEDTYIPAFTLARPELQAQSVVVAAGHVRQCAANGKIVLDLTVEDWDNLGSTLTQAIEEAKNEAPGLSSLPQRIGGLALNAMGAATSNTPVGARARSPWQQRIEQARFIQPYTITRGFDITV